VPKRGAIPVGSITAKTLCNIGEIPCFCTPRTPKIKEVEFAGPRISGQKKGWSPLMGNLAHRLGFSIFHLPRDCKEEKTVARAVVQTAVKGRAGGADGQRGSLAEQRLEPLNRADRLFRAVNAACLIWPAGSWSLLLAAFLYSSVWADSATGWRQKMPAVGARDHR